LAATLHINKLTKYPLTVNLDFRRRFVVSLNGQRKYRVQERKDRSQEILPDRAAEVCGIPNR
jgi:hypothetical protein